MNWRSVRMAFLLGAAFAATAMVAQAQAGDGSGPKAAAPSEGKAVEHGDGYITVPCTVWVPQTYTTYRTCYRTEYRKVTRTVHSYECVPVKKYRTCTYYVRKPVYKTVERTVYERVPCVETRTVMRPCWETKKVTVWKTRRVDRGGWVYCQEPAPVKDFFNRLNWRLRSGGLFHRCNRGGCCDTGCGDPCGDPCANACARPCPPPPATRCVKRWKSNYVCEKYPVTCCKRVCVYKPVTCKVCTYKCVAKKVKCRVCTYECVACTRKVCCTVYERRCVARKVTCCEPVRVCVRVPVRCCKLVPKTIHRRVAACDPCGDPCGDPCCVRRHHRRFFDGCGGILSGLFNRGRGCCDAGCGHRDHGCCH